MRSMLCLAIAVGALACNSNGEGDDTGSPPVSADAPVFINEFVASNKTGLQDESGAFPDWIELYNDGDAEVDLGGWWITDDLGERLKWQIPAGIKIPAKGYLVFFADGDTAEGDLHLPFSLSQLGEDIALFGPSSINNPEIDSIAGYGPQASDQSWARLPDGSSEWGPDPSPTPGAANDGQ